MIREEGSSKNCFSSKYSACSALVPAVAVPGSLENSLAGTQKNQCLASVGKALLKAALSCTSCHPSQAPGILHMRAPIIAVSEAISSGQPSGKATSPQTNVPTPCRAASSIELPGIEWNQCSNLPSLGNEDIESHSSKSIIEDPLEVPEIAAWPSEQEVLIQITFDEAGASCSSLGGTEIFRLHESRLRVPMTAQCLQASIQENYERAMDITLFVDAQPLASEDRVYCWQSLCAKCSMHIPELWVVRWVDFPRFGLGYILSDDSVGVYFNDSTKIVVLHGSSRFDYITRHSNEDPASRNTYAFEDYPDDLRKKVTLLRHFRNMLLNNLERAGASKGKSSFPCCTRSPQRKRDSGELTYVSKWQRLDQGIIFHLTNKTYQVVFNDKTELLLSSKSKFVTYFNEKNQVSSYPVKESLSPQESFPPDMKKRLNDFIDHIKSERLRTSTNS